MTLILSQSDLDELCQQAPKPQVKNLVLDSVQSYISGTSLQELLNQGQRFSESQVEKIAIEILSILVYLHSLEPPVLHRDIKPSNLILGDDERVYLVDFGAEIFIEKLL